MVKYGLLPELLPNVSFNTQADNITSSTYYKVATSIFNYLCKHQRQDGSIYDQNMSSTLDAQYHHANFGLTSIILSILNSDDTFYDKAYKSFKYYIDIPMEQKKGAVDFSNFPILVSYLLLMDKNNQCRLKTLLNKYIEEMTHHATVEKGNTYGNNFVTLRALNHLLRFKMLGREEDIKLSQYFMDCTLKWQFDDGIFYDYPRQFNYQKGIPSLAYHSKITLITLLFGIVSKEKDIVDKALYGLEALAKLMAYDGETFYYGRTNNAIYGYACGILAFRVASNFSKDINLAQKYKECERVLFRFCSRHMAEDGHLYIVPNDLENERCGFDNYMYITVYNAFTTAMLLLSLVVEDTTTALRNVDSPEVHYFKQSGFIMKKGGGISTAFNLKGHNYYQQYLLDPRFTCGTPLFVKFNGHDILPTIPFSSPGYSQDKNESLSKKLLRKINEAVSETKCWGYLQNYNPLYAGFMPYLEGKNNWYIPLKITGSEVSTVDNLLFVKAYGKFISVKRKGFWPFVIFIVDTMRKYVNVSPAKLRNMLISESDSYFERTIVIEDAFIHFHDKIWGNVRGDVHFSIRTFCNGTSELNNNRFRYEGQGYGFELLLEKGEIVKEREKLCSSKGKAYYWDLSRKEKFYKRKNKEVITLDHTLIPFDMEHTLADSMSYFRSLSAKISQYIEQA